MKAVGSTRDPRPHGSICRGRVGRNKTGKGTGGKNSQDESWKRVEVK